MKMVLVVYSRAADYDVLSTFKQAGIRGYTKLEKAFGEGTETEPKLHTHTWPGENNMLFIALEDDSALPEVMDLVRRLKKEHPRTGMKAFVLPMEEII
ncbi:MAG TPA: hypothetical protein PLA83_09275 [Deltaproteobacteria bacterium]|jgi:nitrogen regulatory protein PII|nr:hypothetical protein [Deltaproteobacteria bacterium]HQI02114.1 hypothetical protein [Deltaproteobacteria bacterium]